MPPETTQTRPLHQDSVVCYHRRNAFILAHSPCFSDNCPLNVWIHFPCSYTSLPWRGLLQTNSCLCFEIPKVFLNHIGQSFHPIYLVQIHEEKHNLRSFLHIFVFVQIFLKQMCIFAIFPPDFKLAKPLHSHEGHRRTECTLSWHRS